METRELRKIASECREVAEAYEQSPGLAGPGANAGTIIDIFKTIARLADTVADAVPLKD